jgi:hypothetical protein
MVNFNIRDTKWTPGWKGYPECYVKIKTPGVTSVINSMIPDPEMEDWVRKIGKEKADEIMTLAGYRGTAMHLFIENFITILAKSKDPSEALRVTQEETPPELLNVEKVPQYKIDEGRNLFYKFYYSDFANAYMGLIQAELPIFSATDFFRGKADVFHNDRVFGPSVVDFKTSNGYIKKGTVKELKYKYQLGGYATAIDEMYKAKGLVIKRSSILCVNTKTEQLQEVVLAGAELEEYKDKFRNLARDWHIKHDQSYLLS